MLFIIRRQSQPSHNVVTNRHIRGQVAYLINEAVFLFSRQGKGMQVTLFEFLHLLE